MGLRGTRKRWSEEDYIKRSFMICTPHKILFGGDRIKKNEMGSACSVYGGQESCIQGLGGET